MKSVILFAFAFLSYTGIQAQHCPFDGTHLIAIKVVDKNNKLLKNTNTTFYLQEVDNPMADSCSSAPGLVREQFLSKDSFNNDINKYFGRNGYNTELNKRLAKAGVFKNANMMLTINQAQNTCTLIGKSETVYTNYIYQQRKFEVVYTINGKENHIPLPEDFIYSLCTGRDEVNSFKTIAIKL